MRILSLFSGIGALDLAVESALGGETLAHVEASPFCRRVLRARWPDAEQHDDVTTYRAKAGAFDVVCGGFPCQDLSVAGARAGLDGERSGLYAQLLRVVGEALPQTVVIENVPPLRKYRQRVDADLAALGYGATWVHCDAASVGAPHWRKRVVIVAQRGGESATIETWQGRDSKRWPGYPGTGEAWPTPTAHAGGGNGNPGGDGKVKHQYTLERTVKDEQARAAAPWPTMTAGDANSTGSRSLPGSGAHTGTSLTDAIRPDRSEAYIGALSPAWCELLMGLPCGWTDPTDANVDLDAWPGWPAWRYCDQFAYEPARTVAPRTVKDRPSRVKALGNAVVWQMAAAAIVAAIGGTQ